MKEEGAANCSNDCKSIFRGYTDNKQIEIISSPDAKVTIDQKLKDLSSNLNLSEYDQKIIQDIVFTCLDKLDQNRILKGHIRGITEGFIPALIEKKDCVKSFYDPNAFTKGFDHEIDEISVNDFIFQSLTRKCKPTNLTRLVYRSEGMPTIDSRKILQNRTDGVTLGREVGFNALREMIHDQKNAGLPTVTAMILFYETGDSSSLEEQITSWKNRYPEDDMSPLLNRHLYEKTFLENNQNPHSPKIRTIDVLYRLQENLSFIGFEAPSTPNQELNQALEITSANFSHPSIESLNIYEKSLTLLNEIFISAIQKEQIGIDPSYIATTNWLRERIGKILSELPFEAIEELYTKNCLKEILRLMELTASSNSYDQNEFESFVQQYQSKKSFQEAYKLIYKRSVSRQAKTYLYLKENASCEYLFGANLTINELNNTNRNIESQLASLGDLTTHKPTTNKGRDRYHLALGMT